MKVTCSGMCTPRIPVLAALGLSLWIIVAPMAEAGVLRLDDAERIALEKDPVVQAGLARSDALEAEAVADGQLPDPKFRTGLYNAPLDDFDLRREPSTQLRFGLQQAFPRGNTLAYKEKKTRAKASAERLRARLESLKILRDVRKTYLEIYYRTEAAGIIRASRKLFESLTDITRVQYASGGSSQQDVLRAELELSRLEDRLTQIKASEENARARLSRWLGKDAWRPVQDILPHLPIISSLAGIREKLEQHPQILLQSAIIETHQQAVAISREQYKPGWTLGAEYRMRFGDNPNDSNRSDMGAVMLTMDIPLFTEKRQDKRLQASQKRADAAYLDRENSWRMLREKLAAAQSSRERLEERLERYQERLIKDAEENAKAALLAYQSGTIEFTGLMRARITELDIHLQALKLRVDLLKTQADLLYLAAGEEQ
ncbi:TolC family protein [Thiolapillus sp.]